MVIPGRAHCRSDIDIGQTATDIESMRFDQRLDAFGLFAFRLRECSHRNELETDEIIYHLNVISFGLNQGPSINKKKSKLPTFCHIVLFDGHLHFTLTDVIYPLRTHGDAFPWPASHRREQFQLISSPALPFTIETARTGPNQPLAKKTGENEKFRFDILMRFLC